MDLYEIGDLINSSSSNIIAGQAVFISIISGYLIVAYTVGKKLTKYQVSFINLVFVISNITGFIGLMAQSNLVWEYAELRASLNGGQEFNSAISESWRILFSGVRILLVVGALVFMWQVRHPKRG